MIAREQVADLRPGDVVELAYLAWPELTIVGPLRRHGPGMWVGPIPILDSQGGVVGDMAIARIVARVPRLYVNHPRTEPVRGDVAREADTELTGRVWVRGESWRWAAYPNEVVGRLADVRLRLLVDGETGQVVPS